MNEALRAITERSSTRGYQKEKIAPEVLEQLIKAGLEAPTAANKQEIHFSVIDGEAAVLQEIEASEIAPFLSETITPERLAVSVIRPAGGEKEE